MRLQRQTFKAADVGVVAENNFRRLQQLREQIANHWSHPIERERLNLHDEGIAKLIHD